MYRDSYEHELTATPFSNTINLDEVLPYTLEELRILTEKFLTVGQLADTIVPGAEALLLVRRADILGQLLSSALNGDSSTVFGRNPRSKIAEELNYDIVDKFHERGNQLSTYPAELILQYRVANTIEKFDSTMNQEVAYRETTLRFEQQRDAALDETVKLEGELAALQVDDTCRKLSFENN